MTKESKTKKSDTGTSTSTSTSSIRQKRKRSTTATATSKSPKLKSVSKVKVSNDALSANANTTDVTDRELPTFMRYGVLYNARIDEMKGNSNQHGARDRTGHEDAANVNVIPAAADGNNGNNGKNGNNGTNYGNRIHPETGYGNIVNTNTNTNTNEKRVKSTPNLVSGTCYECRGRRNHKLPKDHPVLLCDGPGCTREYHLSCVQNPKPLHKVPTGSFYCIDCDPHGSSSTLSTYFDAIDDLRAEFDTSRELVDFLLCLHTRGLKAGKKLLEKSTRSSSGNNSTNMYNTSNDDDADDEKNINYERSDNDSDSDSDSSNGMSSLDKTIQLVAPEAFKSSQPSSPSSSSSSVPSSPSPSPKQLASVLSSSSSSTQTNQTNDYPTSELCRATELHRVAYSEPDFLKLLIHHSLPRPKPMAVPKSATNTKMTTATTATTATTVPTVPTVPILSKGTEDSSTDLKKEDLSAITKVPQKSTKVTLTKKESNPIKESNTNSIFTDDDDNDTNDEGIVGAESLVGKVVRLYCPIDNQYHHGRIIDWRSARLLKLSSNILSSDNKRLFSINDDIGTSEFLILFPGGLNGRKDTVTKWVILEEHSLAVQTAMVMAQRDRGRGINGWKPAQIALRTTIELIPIRDLVKEDGHWALAIFFGDENHQYIDLDREAANLFSERFEEYRMSKLTHLPLSKSSYVQGVTAFMEMVMSLVKAELDEQKRSFNWHKLQLENYAHPKCLSMKSEYGLQPLEVDRKSSSTLLLRKNGVNGDENDGVLISETKKEEEEEIFDVHQIRPKLCPLIQFGLDRQWLCDQISDEEFTLDTIASLSCKISKPSAQKMALLKGKL